MKSKKTQINSIKRRLSKKYRSLKSRGGSQESGLTKSELEKYIQDGLYYPVSMKEGPKYNKNEKYTAFYKVTSFDLINDNMNLHPNLEPGADRVNTPFRLVDDKSCSKNFMGKIKCVDNLKYAVNIVDKNVENTNPPQLYNNAISDEDKKKYGEKLTLKIKVLQRILK